MNPAPPLQIGDEVEIVVQAPNDTEMRVGKKFVITQASLSPEKNIYSTKGFPWYPATSLRKVRVVDEDELQIGDWVEVTGPDDHGFGHTIGEKFRISLLNRPGAPFPWASDTGRAFYPASSLRKLKPCEISPTERGELAGRFSKEIRNFSPIVWPNP
jgi:hypothetical protein